MESTEAALEADRAPGEDGPAVEFRHPFFRSVENGHFRRAESSDEPVFVIRLGEDDAVLPLDGIKREFGLGDDDPDGQMLTMVAEALNYVKLLRPGQAIPKEVTTGEPSWEIEQEHRDAARQRLTLQLAGWMTGSEILFTGREELSQLAEDPRTRDMADAALDAAGAKLGLDPGGREKVAGMVEGLVAEFAPIEALRDRFQNIPSMLRKAKGLRQCYARSTTMRENADACVRMLTLAQRSYGEIFEVVDGQTSEILGVLKNFDQQREFIRTVRNDLYKRLEAWSEVFEAWRHIEPQHSPYNEEWLGRTYRFLAPRFLKADDWELLTRYEPKDERETERRWEDSYWDREQRVTSFADALGAKKKAAKAPPGAA